MTNNAMEKQQQHDGQDRPLDEDPEIHQSPPSGSGYVEPRIQEIERRIQLRTPEPKNSNHRQPPCARPNSNGDNNRPASSDKNTNNNHALVLHSPILSSILPNSNIKQFESDVLKKQAQYSARISDLEGRLALFHARLAVECAERGREHAFTMEEYVVEPLEQAARRSLGRIETEFVRPIMDPKRASAISTCGSTNGSHKEGGSGDGRSTVGQNGETGTTEMTEEGQNSNSNNTPTDTNALPNLVAIERGTNLLEAQMNHHQHVTLYHSRRQNFDAIDKTSRKTLQPALALEMTKADKREGGMVRRFESSSGEYTRLVSEMSSSRVSALGYIEKEIIDWDISDLTRAEHYSDEIQKMKQRVLEERAERERQDKLVYQTIEETRKMWEGDIFSTCYPGGA